MKNAELFKDKGTLAFTFVTSAIGATLYVTMVTCHHPVTVTTTFKNGLTLFV